MTMDEAIPGETLSPRATIVCRCEEVLDQEVAAALTAGARTVDDVKRRTRAGMGACQGLFCVPMIAALVAQATGTRIESVAPMTARPPVRPIALAALAALSDDDRDEGTGQASVGEERV
jgi:bacterioferritin-associated ferredoxin